MSDQKRTPKPKKPVNVRFYHGDLRCIKGDLTWRANDLNESRKVVQCPSCGADNDIQEAKKRVV